MRVLVFGDSIAFGGYDVEGGWVDRLKKYFLQKHIDEKEELHQIVNLGIGGDTSEFLLARMQPSFGSANASGRKSAAIVAIGLGDSRWLTDYDAPQTSISDFRANIEKILLFLKDNASHACIVGLTSLAVKSLERKNFRYEKERIAEFDSVLKAKAKEFGVSYIDLGDFVDRSELYFRDDIHLNSLGHNEVCDRVLPHIEKVVLGLG